MSINRAVLSAYRTMKARNWDTLYWAVDLHGTCFPSNYESGGYKFINESCKTALQTISNRPESKIILWSGVYPAEMRDIIDFFASHDIKIASFNCNMDVPNTETGCFDNKWYFNILVDDKAGFNPETDWETITTLLNNVL